MGSKKKKHRTLEEAEYAHLAKIQQAEQAKPAPAKFAPVPVNTKQAQEPVHKPFWNELFDAVQALKTSGDVKPLQELQYFLSRIDPDIKYRPSFREPGLQLFCDLKRPLTDEEAQGTVDDAIIRYTDLDQLTPALVQELKKAELENNFFIPYRHIGGYLKIASKQSILWLGKGDEASKHKLLKGALATISLCVPRENPGPAVCAIDFNLPIIYSLDMLRDAVDEEDKMRKQLVIAKGGDTAYVDDMMDEMTRHWKPYNNERAQEMRELAIILDALVIEGHMAYHKFDPHRFHMNQK